MAEAAVDRGDDFEPTGPDVVDEQVSEDTTADLPEELPDNDVEEESPAQPDAEKADPTIPKSRFDAAVAKEREQKEALQRRLQELESREQQRATAQNTQESQAKLKDMIKEHTSLLADGELDKASEVMGNILQLQQDMADARVQAASSSAKNQAKAEVQYDATVSRLETDYPAINPDSDTFDERAVTRIQALMTGLIQGQNMSPAAALEDAVVTILGPKAAPAAAPASPDLGMRRKETAVAKAMDAQKRQPANTRDVGVDSDKVGGPLDAAAVMKMSFDEFMKLPESELSKMRGDYVE